jgi:hypothetical protein
MSAMSFESVSGTFGDALEREQRLAIISVCDARGFVLDLENGTVTVPGQLLHARCADLPLPPGFHVSIAERGAGSTCLRLVRMF